MRTWNKPGGIVVNANLSYINRHIFSNIYIYICMPAYWKLRNKNTFEYLLIISSDIWLLRTFLIFSCLSKHINCLLNIYQLIYFINFIFFQVFFDYTHKHMSYRQILISQFNWFGHWTWTTMSESPPLAQDNDTFRSVWTPIYYFSMFIHMYISYIN